MLISTLINVSLFSCGLVGLLMLALTLLAFLKGRQKLGEKTGILIIVFVLLAVLIALSIHEI
jgi:hypothetical protein